MLKIYGIQLFLSHTKIKDTCSCHPYRQQALYACTCAVTSSFFGSHLPSLICIGQLSFLLFLLMSLALVASVSLLANAFFLGWSIPAKVIGCNGRLRCVVSWEGQIVSVPFYSSSVLSLCNVEERTCVKWCALSSGLFVYYSAQSLPLVIQR